jgi:hypothetical protein
MGSSSTSQGQYTFVQSSRAIGHFIPVPEEDSTAQDRVSNAAGAVIDFIRSKVTGVSDSTPPPQPQQYYAPSRGVGTDGSHFVNYQQHLMNPEGLKNVQPMGGWVDPAEAGSGVSSTPFVEQLLTGSTTPSRTEIAQTIQSIQTSSVELEDVIRQLCLVAVAAQATVRWQQRLRALVLLDALRAYAAPSSFLASQEFLGLFQNAYIQFALHKSVQDKAEQLWLSLYGPDRPSPLQQDIIAKANAQKSVSLFEGLSAANAEEPAQGPDTDTASIFNSLSLAPTPTPTMAKVQQSQVPKNTGLLADHLLLLNFGDSQQHANQTVAPQVAPASPLLTQLNNSRPSISPNVPQTPPVGSGNLMDLSGLSFPSAAPVRSAQPQAAPAIDSFSFVAGEFKKKDAAAPAAAAPVSSSNSGSSFDFL